ncbi:metallophosphoesterase family protein [Bacillus sp. 2205SS5-2]|uniref:metallophosphoesterase family protein n=1 Tax=Bacillus sp. 2205SS5-2 TaxID=3109031 RepID=UPI003004E322
MYSFEKVAFITDIHGNAPALIAALREIDQSGVEVILCGGDLIGIGPDSKKVLSILSERPDVLVVSGNHDEAIVALLEGGSHPKSHAHALVHHQWIAENIHPSYLTYLKNLPRQIRFTIGGKSTLLTHYGYNFSKMNAPVSADPLANILHPTLENMEILFQHNEEEIILFGHHHPQHLFEGGSMFINPGSLGCHNKSTARYAIIEKKHQHIYVNMKAIWYDRSEFLKSYHSLVVPQSDVILPIFHGVDMN